MPAALNDLVAAPVRALAWLGRQGTRAIAALVIIGIALPPLGEWLRPYVTEAIFLLLCVSFMRVDLSALRAHLRRPAIVLAATAWTMVAVPAIIGTGYAATGFDKSAPDLFLGVMLQGLASPMMAAPALAALMGLDATLVLITLVTGSALVPLTAPLFAYVFLGGTLTLSPFALGAKLLVILAGVAGRGGGDPHGRRRGRDPAPQGADRRRQHPDPAGLRQRGDGAGGRQLLADALAGRRRDAAGFCDLISRCWASPCWCSAGSGRSRRWRSG